jgi:hypothetical protein
MPWNPGESSKRNFRLYYQVVLGSIGMSPAAERLIDRYGDERPERPAVLGRTPLAILVVDQKGRLVEEPAVTVSSFPWGVMTALRGNIAGLGRWSEVEATLVQVVEEVLLGVPAHEIDDKLRKSTVLSFDRIRAAFIELITRLNLPGEWIEPPTFAIRSYVHLSDKSPPEPLLLNSFFLQDLERTRKAARSGGLAANLSRYLGATRSPQPRNLLEDVDVLSEAIRPGRSPVARWPGPGRHPLVLLQQAAANLAFAETTNGGLIGINGPPGTGKTTLLRDVIAGVITQRAEVMSAFDNPEAAFSDSNHTFGGKPNQLKLYKLDSRLRGFEMVVASSNNRAVENISREIPALQAIAADAESLRYFQSLADHVYGAESDAPETWGLIAAVLGNMGNRAQFGQRFWRSDDHGLNSYLLAIGGAITQIQEVDPDTGELVQRPARIIDCECPPTTREAALRRWRTARTNFQDALTRSRRRLEQLEDIRADLIRHPKLLEAKSRAQADIKQAEHAIGQRKAALEKCETHERRCEHEFAAAESRLRDHRREPPSCWTWLIDPERYRRWLTIDRELMTGWRATRDERQAAGVRRRNAVNELTEADVRLNAARTELGRILAECAQVDQRIAAAREQGVAFAHGDDLPDNHRDRQLLSPWFTPTDHRLRDEVFAAAISLHRAFIDASAPRLRHNLAVLMKLFHRSMFTDAGRRELLPHLWSSLFLVVPVISTTFASVNRMLGHLPTDSLGWLLVDEAGQALPQAAVGAIDRSRRVVVVGDPAQIEPVVVIPQSLTTAICQTFGVDTDTYAAPLASVQTLADLASSHRSQIEGRDGSRTVGSPLLVHRRCAEPMFGISNTIAYAGLMVHATPQRNSIVREILGPSCWLDIVGPAEDKWCPEEGKQVLQMLWRLREAMQPTDQQPDLYIVTPYRMVAQRLRDVVEESGVLDGWVRQQPHRWVREQIGTVHTVQGREAEAVIFVLGAPLAGQSGARGWAGGRPNLLNVAVSRAKEVLYVIGNRTLWREAGVFKELDRQLP